MTAIATLRRVLPRLRELGADGMWLADGFEAWLDPAAGCRSLEAALGLDGGARGRRTPRTVDQIARRDAAIRALAHRHFPGRPVLQQALAIRDAARAYAGGAWRRDRALLECPTSYRGTIRETLFVAMQAHANFPDSISQLTTILSAGEE